MNGISRLALAGAVGLGLPAVLAAASSPSALAGVSGGLWEISRNGAPPVRLCIADPAALAQFEHRRANCTRNLVRDSASAAIFDYTCTGGGFGHSNIKVITPRSLRIETQGIADNAPFKYVLQARRLGNCPAH